MFHRKADNVQSTSSAEKRAPEATRRQFGALGLVAAVGGLGGAVSAAVSKTATTERSTTIATSDGSSQARFFHPESGKHRGLVMWSVDEAAGQEVAREMAEQGWAVLLVHDQIDDRRTYQQARAFVAWLEQQDSVAATGKGEEGRGLGFGYSLRNVTATLPRFSFSTTVQREKAAMAATLFAVPDSVVPAQKLDTLSDAARLIHQNQS